MNKSDLERKQIVYSILGTALPQLGLTRHDSPLIFLKSNGTRSWLLKTLLKSLLRIASLLILMGLLLAVGVMSSGDSLWDVLICSSVWLVAISLAFSAN